MISGRAEGFWMSFQPLVYIYPTFQGMSRADGNTACLAHNYNDLTGQAALVHDTQFPIYLTPVMDWHCPLFCGFKCR